MKEIIEEMRKLLPKKYHKDIEDKIVRAWFLGNKSNLEQMRRIIKL